MLKGKVEKSKKQPSWYGISLQSRKERVIKAISLLITLVVASILCSMLDNFHTFLNPCVSAPLAACTVFLLLVYVFEDIFKKSSKPKISSLTTSSKTLSELIANPQESKRSSPPSPNASKAPSTFSSTPKVPVLISVRIGIFSDSFPLCEVRASSKEELSIWVTRIQTLDTNQMLTFCLDKIPNEPMCWIKKSEKEKRTWPEILQSFGISSTFLGPPSSLPPVRIEISSERPNEGEVFATSSEELRRWSYFMKARGDYDLWLSSASPHSCHIQASRFDRNQTKSLVEILCSLGIPKGSIYIKDREVSSPSVL